ncbi:exodeoxyribonuclease VII large subunit [Treponema sp.]|uniref:exodeoxyribonuclease VII large subunit n=1 Tax=Treponema sp. TaxID=166 RepID=UPI00298D66BC|nr:exodeoxyribonuclease VII large subunit [Treponema sp.]
MEAMFPERKDNSLTVTQLTNLIKNMLENSFQNILLKGEISNFKPSSAGHLYFSLKDADAQISAVMFRGSASNLTFQPKDGTMVQARGKISVYAPRGNYQLIIISMEKAGTGNIMEMIEQRKRKLAAEGLFDSARKRTLPYFPKTVGIVTSPGGAALRDILNIRKRRNDKVEIIVLPSLVQGDTAAPTIVNMIQIANRRKLCDVLIVGRGGGSLEDLLPFSEESVVRAIAASEIPVVSAVGHEIDWALSDFAADCRAPTPSAAAEIVIPEKTAILNEIDACKTNLYGEITERTRSLRLLLKSFDPENMHTRLLNIEQRLSERFDRAFDSMKSSMEELIKNRRRTIEHSREILENCNPQSIFERGYSMVTDRDGNIIRDAHKLNSGDQIKIRPAKGEIEATVN